MDAAMSRNTATIQRQQLLLPYPQFTGLTIALNQGYSWYHGFSTRVEKRFSHGYTIQGSYTWSKYMDATSRLNAQDVMPTKVIAANDRPQHLAASGIYELPFGKGKPILGSARGWLNQIVSNWSATAIYQAQTGAPIGFGNIVFNGDIHSIVLPISQRTPDRWFNTDAGFEKNAALQPASNYRAFPSLLTGLRAGGINDWDVSLIKRFPIRERLGLELRADAKNLANHPMFAAPNTTPTSSLFGQVTSTQGAEQRAVTVMGQLSW
jgi:hypothetical protein